VASGGHSHIVYVKSYNEYEVLGATLDDAAGEAFDKVARVLAIGYPGGPLLSRHAESGNPDAIAFPRPINGLDFSFSGVKTNVINYIHKLNQQSLPVNSADIAASFQKAIVDVLTDVTIRAAKKEGVHKIAIAGGVASNTSLRESLSKAAKENDFYFNLPPADLCTDNAAMISCAGYYNFISGQIADLDLNAIATLKI